MFDPYQVALAQLHTLQLAATAYTAKWLKETQTVYREGGRFASPVSESANKAFQKPVKPNQQLAETPSPSSSNKPVKRPTTKTSVAGYPVNIKHIFQGDIENNQLRGGMHTKQAADTFCNIYGYEYDVLRKQKNGVMEIELPPGAMKAYPDGRIPENRKTLFPERWNNDKIMDAIEDVVQNNKVLGYGDRQFVEGVHEGVRLRVCLKNDKIVTSYPVF